VSDVLVLCYHAVSETWPASLSVRPRELERQLRALVERGYVGATFHEALTAPRSERTLAVTFDDGFRSVASRAAPIMSDLGLVGTVFVVTGYLAGDRPLAWAGTDHWLGSEHEPELEPLSPVELDGLVEAGWEIGSHTRTHPRLTRLDDASLAAELRGSRERCERRLGRPCLSLAYPYGDVDERVVAAARDAGYETAGALPRRFETRDTLSWPRVGVYFKDGSIQFKLKTSPAIRRLRSSPAWDALDALRRGASRRGSRPASIARG
jgi:peptidoglycan/xylan/chitin deacetylase (PgdA/CDA1 family)